MFSGDDAYVNYKKRKFLVNDKYQKQMQKQQEEEFADTRRQIEKGIKKVKAKEAQKRLWAEESAQKAIVEAE